MLSADEILRARLPVTSFREGYDQTEVDAFLDRAVRTLRDRATRPLDAHDVTAQEVDRLVLRTRRLVTGYDMAAVDALLSRLRDTLDAPPPPPRTTGAALANEPTGRRRGPARRVPLHQLIAFLVVGLPPQRPPRAVTPRRARRVRARWVQVTDSGISWAPPLRTGGHLDAADVGEIVELVLTYPRSGGTTYYLVVDREGAVRLRVHEWWHKPVRRMWEPLRHRVRVTAGDLLHDRAKDARRTWPEAFSWAHAYPYLTLTAVAAVYMGVVVPVLTALGHA
ncbi:DivIVA domain-containing protein [Cellulomonas phragmiteti]|uniref:DivIVA domain-containing protein n=1 Tax=Cellulomonas phragmiteti TaxID=478780 RepID=UPI0019459B45|nr:DivIVA domain-containing protein [Cellulomonas phragmiteti]